jgi:site-specific recombinase XerD
VLLRSIETTSAMGLRDYAMFLLIATYGLRASEVVALSLDDILAARHPANPSAQNLLAFGIAPYQ